MPDLFLVPFLLVLLSTQSSLVYPVSFHYVLCLFWMVFWIEILGSRSTLPGQFSHDMRLTSGFAGVLRVHQRSSCSPPLPTRRSVFCTSQGSSWRVWTTSPPTASPHHGLWRTSAALASPTSERPSSGRAWLSRATRGGSHSPPLLRAFVVGYFPVFVLLCFVFGFSVVTSLCLSPYWCLSSLNSLYILYHLNWWPRFLTSVSRIIWPAILEALPPCTFVLSLNFGLPNPCFYCFSFLL
jgi:hypothetical protein